MSKLKRQLREDKALRDAARTLVEADVEQVKSLASPAKLKDRASEKAADVSGKGGEALNAAKDAADKNKGYLAAVAGAAILWLAREPIQALFEKLSEQLEKPDASNTETDAQEENP